MELCQPASKHGPARFAGRFSQYGPYSSQPTVVLRDQNPLLASPSPPSMSPCEHDRRESWAGAASESQDAEANNTLEGGRDILGDERSAIAKIYEEIVHWRKKLFSVPGNAVGKTL